MSPRNTQPNGLVQRRVVFGKVRRARSPGCSRRRPLRDEETEVDVAAQLDGRLTVAHQLLRWPAAARTPRRRHRPAASSSASARLPRSALRTRRSHGQRCAPDCQETWRQQAAQPSDTLGTLRQSPLGAHKPKRLISARPRRPHSADSSPGRYARVARACLSVGFSLWPPRRRCARTGPFPTRRLSHAADVHAGRAPGRSSNVYADASGAARLGKQLYFEAALLGPARAVQRAGDNGSLGTRGETGKVACASCHDPATGRRRSPFAAQRDQPGRGVHRPQRAVGDQRRLLPALAVLGRPRRFVVEPGAAAARRVQAECNGSRLPSRTSSTLTTTAPNTTPCSARALPDLSRPSRFPPAGKPGEPAFDAHERRRQEDRSTTLRQLRQGDRRLRTPAGQHRVRAVAVRRLHGRRRRRRCRRRRFEARGCSSAGPAATSATAARCSPTSASTTSARRRRDRMSTPSTLGPLRRGIDMTGARRPVQPRSDFSDYPERSTSPAHALDPTAPSDAHRRPVQDPVPAQRRARPPPTCTTASTRRCGTWSTTTTSAADRALRGHEGSGASRRCCCTDAELGDLVEFLRALDDGPRCPLRTSPKA